MLAQITELTTNRDIFIKTLETLATQFNLASTLASIETNENRQGFTLRLDQTPPGQPIAVFVPCTMTGPALKTTIDIGQLKTFLSQVQDPTEQLTLRFEIEGEVTTTNGKAEQ